MLVDSTILTGSVLGWRAIQNRGSEQDESEQAPVGNRGAKIKELTAIAKYYLVTGNAGLSGDGEFRGSIYNGTDWNITKIKFKVLAKERDGSIRWTRYFMCDSRWLVPPSGIWQSTTSIIEPLATKGFRIYVTGDRDIGSTTWNIDTVWGYKIAEQ